MTTTELSPKQLGPYLKAMFQVTVNAREAGRAVPCVFVQSAPGLGKSRIAADVAKELGVKFTDIRLAYAAPVDVRGFPFLENGAMQFAAPAQYPREEGNLVLLDEFTCAPRATQLASLEWLLDGRIGEYVDPPNTMKVLAGNRAIDRAHVERMSSATVNRVVQIVLRPDLDDWFDWAFSAGVDPRVIAFLRFRPDALSNFKGSEWDGDTAFASPRSWEMVSTTLDAVSSLDTTTRQGHLEGLIGPGAACEFTSFLNIFDKLPDIDGILNNPTRGDVPGDPSVQLALCAALAPRIELGNWGNAITYLARLTKEFEVFGFKMIAKQKPRLMQTPESSAWLQKNKDTFVGC